MTTKSRIFRAFALLAWLLALLALAALSRTQIHQINRLSDGSYEIVYYQVLAWRFSAPVYYALAAAAALLVCAGALIVWRRWRQEAHVRGAPNSAANAKPR